MSLTKNFGRKIYLVIKYHGFWIPSRKMFLMGQERDLSVIGVWNVWIHDSIHKLISICQNKVFGHQ